MFLLFIFYINFVCIAFCILLPCTVFSSRKNYAPTGEYVWILSQYLSPRCNNVGCCTKSSEEKLSSVSICSTFFHFVHKSIFLLQSYSRIAEIFSCFVTVQHFNLLSIRSRLEIKHNGSVMAQSNEFHICNNNFQTLIAFVTFFKRKHWLWDLRYWLAICF